MPARRHRGLLLLAALLPFAALSCAGDYYFPPIEPEKAWSYDEVVEACGLEVDTYGLLPFDAHGDLQEPVTEECMETVGSAFGFSWASFDEVAHEFDVARTPLERVMEGFLMVLGWNGAMVADVLDGGGPVALTQLLSEYEDAYHLKSTIDAGELWFALLYDSIQKVYYYPDLDAKMSYVSNKGLVYIGDVTDEVKEPALGNAWDKEIIASGLIHEASHAIYGGHVQCGDNPDNKTCDEDKEGAFGSQVWWYYNWLTFNAELLDEWFCISVRDNMYLSCFHINDHGDYLPCDEEQLWWTICPDVYLTRSSSISPRTGIMKAVPEVHS